MSKLWPGVVLLAAGCGSIGEWQPVSVERGLVYLDSELGDGTPVRCLVDTGSAFTMLHTDVVGSEQPVLLVGDRDLVLEAVAAPELDPMLESFGIDCLLGWDSLEPQPFTIDYAGAQLRLTDRKEKDRRLDLGLGLGEPIVVPLTNTRPLPVVEAVFDDVPSLAVADTGAGAALLAPELLAELSDPGPTEPALVMTPDGPMEAQHGVLASITIGGETHADVDFVSYDSVQLDAAAEELETDELRGVIGASTLLRFVVTFDDARGELRLHPYPRSVQDELLDGYRAELEEAAAGGAP